jgi:hypothetical protein
MKKKTTETQTDDMLPEYDFSKAERGKYYRSLEKGYSVRILNEDGTITEIDEFDALIQQARKQAEKAGLKKKDIRSAVAKARRRKSKQNDDPQV